MWGRFKFQKPPTGRSGARDLVLVNGGADCILRRRRRMQRCASALGAVRGLLFCVAVGDQLVCFELDKQLLVDNF